MRKDCLLKQSLLEHDVNKHPTECYRENSQQNPISHVIPSPLLPIGLDGSAVFDQSL